MKEACHHNLYALANSLAMNGIGKDTTIVATEPGCVSTAKLVRNVSIIVFVLFAAIWTVRGSQFKKTEAYTTWKVAKKAK